MSALFACFDRRVGAVIYEGLVVLGDDDIEFECADADFECFGEAAQRLLGRLAAPAAMGLQIES